MVIVRQGRSKESSERDLWFNSFYIQTMEPTRIHTDTDSGKEETAIVSQVPSATAAQLQHPHHVQSTGDNKTKKPTQNDGIINGAVAMQRWQILAKVSVQPFPIFFSYSFCHLFCCKDTSHKTHPLKIPTITQVQLAVPFTISSPHSFFHSSLN